VSRLRSPGAEAPATAHRAPPPQPHHKRRHYDTGGSAFLAPLKTVSTLASTVPANGDVNPYGIVLVPSSVGKLHAGALLVSNFNAKEAAKESGQGTGTTIVQVSTAGKTTLFARINAKALPDSCPGGVGLTTALNILPGGYVVVAASRPPTVSPLPRSMAV